MPLPPCAGVADGLSGRSAAKSVNIDLQETERIPGLPVKDDGVGFDPARARHGLGLLGIQSAFANSEGS